MKNCGAAASYEGGGIFVLHVDIEIAWRTMRL